MKKQTYLEFIQSLLSQEEFLEFKKSYQEKVPKSIKLLYSRCDKKTFSQIFSSLQWKLHSPNFFDGEICYNDVLFVKKDEKTTLGSSFLHTSGLFYVQEMAAGLSAQILPLTRGDRVLDLCAAPGGKSIQIADKLLNLGGGFVVSNEPSDPRRKALIFNINRCGVYNTAISGYDGTQIGDLCPESFDKVLVDAPCSGEGMQYKSDKNVLYWDEKGAKKIAQLQKRLLVSGLKALKIGGILVYSTCTLNPIENEEVVGTVYKEYQDAVEIEEVPINEKSILNTNYLTSENANKVARFRPHIQRTGGFFIAKFRKKSSINYKKSEDKRIKNSYFDSSESLQERIRDILWNEWGIEKKDQYCFFSSNKAIYTCSNENISTGMYIEKYGIPIFKIGHEGELIPQQGIATVFGNQAKKNTCELPIDILQELSLNKQIQGYFGEEGKFLIVQLYGKGLFVVKQRDGRIKGKF